MGRWKKLDKLPLAEGIDEDDYLKRLVRAQMRLLRVQQWLSRTGSRAIVAIEGWDAAGKGGLIQRLTEKLDPRPVQVWRIAAPRPDEQGKHYLYRFWEKLPAPGTMVAMAPAAHARRSARSRWRGELGSGGQCAASTPANTSPAPEVSTGVTAGARTSNLPSGPAYRAPRSPNVTMK